MSYLTTAQGKVWAAIIGHVESNNNYAAFAAAGANTSNETAITIGAYQFYGTNAKKLLNLIKTTYPKKFAKADTAGIADDLVNADWTKYSCTKTSDKGKCIISIISSTWGQKCQDTLFLSMVESQLATIVSYGVTDPQGMCMAQNFMWQGGSSAAKRVIAKTEKPYNLENLYAACCTDTGTQVGAYKSRQSYIYQHLKSDWPEDTTTTATTSATTESTTTSSSSSSSSSSSPSSSTPSKVIKWTGKVTTNGGNLNVRTWAGAEYARIGKYPSIKNGTKVGVCDTVKAKDGVAWYYIVIANSTYGFVSSKYITKVS